MFLVIDTDGRAEPRDARYNDANVSDALGGMVLRMHAGPDCPFSIMVRDDAADLPFNPVASVILSMRLHLPVVMCGPVAFGGIVNLDGPAVGAVMGVITDLPPATMIWLLVAATELSASLDPNGPMPLGRQAAADVQALAALLKSIPLPDGYPSVQRMQLNARVN